MKKMFYTLVLIVSSFFFISSNVNAEERNINVDLSLLDNNFEKAIKMVDDYISTNNYSDNYIIAYSSGSYTAYIFPSSASNVSAYYSFSEKGVKFSSTADRFSINPSINWMGKQGTNGAFYGVYNGTVILYSSFNILTDSSNNVLNYISNDFEKSVLCDGSNKILPFYDIQELINNPEPIIDHTHDSELFIIQSFYEVSISKISYLAESISSNYIYLSIFGVFILIFVFELIFRRYL